MQNIDEFIDGLLLEKGITDVGSHIVTEMRSEMKSQLIKQIKKEIVLRFSEDKVSALANKTDSPDTVDSQILEFLLESNINLNEIIEKVRHQYRNLYLNLKEDADNERDN